MKKPILILALLLLSYSMTSAQKLANDGLVITGSVQGIRTKCVDGKPLMEIQLYMQFRNDGVEPLIRIGSLNFFTTKVSYVADKLGDSAHTIVPADIVRYNPYSENPFGPASADDYDPFPYFVDNLDKSEPLSTISPGGYWEFQDTVWAKNGFRTEIKSGATQKECEGIKTKPVPLYSSFELEYHLSLKKFERRADLLTTLQTRWKRFGRLPLDSKGDISFKSQSIAFNTSK